MSELPKDTSITDAQKWVKDICAERGWNKNSPLEIFLLLSEEMGELAKAIRKMTGMRTEIGAFQEGDTRFLREEFADVAMYLFDLANSFSVNIEEAIREKDAINQNRTWK